ncbi:hypothetical protein GO613_12675 [Azoarcus communis]|uniref:hypothetical protein n=1 Tax=Parazoarcus communis TaxID=41977 RepID=UPI0014595130|nr:hypothetical protein [Parazoarcus communis]NMG48955.1 hypothetical protein [Parazoarcus communis]
MKKTVLVAAVCIALHRPDIGRINIVAGDPLPDDLSPQEFEDLARLQAFTEELRDLPDTAGAQLAPNAGVVEDPGANEYQVSGDSDAPDSAAGGASPGTQLSGGGDVPGFTAGGAVPGTHTSAAENGDPADVSAQAAAPAAAEAVPSAEAASPTETGETPPPGGEPAAAKPATRARKTAAK